MSGRPAAGSRRRRPLATLRRAAVLAVLAVVAAAAVVAGPATSAAVKGSLAVISVADSGTGLAGTVAGRPFDVVVEARDTAGVPLVLNQDSRVRLSLASGPGALSGVLDGTIPKGSSRGSIGGAIYSAVANGVSFTVTAVSGPALTPATVTGVNSARTAVAANASPHSPLSLTDPGCATPSPTSPVCGYLVLPNGGTGTVLLSVGSCETILACRSQGGATAELVTAAVSLKDADGQPLYTRTDPATFVLACDKVLCGNGGVAQLPVTIDLTNAGTFTTAPDCPSKGTIGPDQDVCRDTVQSKRDGAGDLYTTILFVHDIRGSYP